MTRKKTRQRQGGLDSLLELDGIAFGLEKYGCWVKFEVHKVEVSDDVPHGIRYSLTLHAKDGTRLFGLDNAHRASDKRRHMDIRVTAYDHEHPDGSRPSRYYPFESPEKLIAYFWKQVDRRIRELYEDG